MYIDLHIHISMIDLHMYRCIYIGRTYIHIYIHICVYMNHR
jgi:hypothetical protein